MDILSFILGYNKGKAQSGEVDDAVLDEVEAYLDAINGETDVSVIGGTSNDDRIKYVTFMLGETELIKYPVIIGDTVKDVVAKKIIEAPTKEPTETTEYSYGGWSLTDGGEADSNALKNVVEDRTVYYVFKESARKYTVKFYDGETLLKSEQVPYGGSSSYEIEKEGYTFLGWSPEPKNIEGHMECYAQWIENADFATASWENIAKVSEAGRAEEKFNIGDTKTVTLTWEDGTTEDIELQIAGFGFEQDFDSKKPVMTLITKNLLSKKSQWATSSNRQAYSFHETDAFKTFLTETVYSALPNNLKAVTKRCVNGSLSYPDIESWAFYIMPPHWHNVFPDKDRIYPTFSDDASRIKTLNGEASSWPLYDNTHVPTIQNMKACVTKQGTKSNAGNSVTTTLEMGVCFLLFI